MILTSLVVGECDNCQKVFIEQDGEVISDYGENENDEWFVGVLFQFCPSCQNVPEVLEKLEVETAAFENAREVFKLEKGEFIHESDVIN